jgi:hypothetical protein
MAFEHHILLQTSPLTDSVAALVTRKENIHSISLEHQIILQTSPLADSVAVLVIN